MKRLNHIFEKICTIDNFRLAFINASRGKSKYREIIKFRKNLENNLNYLLLEVSNLTYKTSEYHIFNLYTGGKWREVYKLPFRDRVVQHAIMNIIEPIFKASFIEDTYSSIKGRGIHRGLYRVKKALKDVLNTKYCLKLDIKKFYPNINHELLKKSLSRKFKDKKLLLLLFGIIDSCNKGVPIGNYTSQYFANFFLTSMDHKIKESLRVKYYFRYCDDIVILGPNKEYLRNLLNYIRIYVEELNLLLKSNWLIFPVKSRGIDFLGYISFHTHTKVRKYIKHNFIRNIKSPKTICSYWGILSHANCVNLWRKYTKSKNYKDFINENIQIVLLCIS